MIRIMLTEDTDRIYPISGGPSHSNLNMGSYICGAKTLSVAEARNLLTKEKRKCTYNGEACAWWLETHGTQKYNSTAFVDAEGSICFDKQKASRMGGIRPVLCLHPKYSRYLHMCNITHFGLGGYTFTIISNEYALCDRIIAVERL